MIIFSDYGSNQTKDIPIEQMNMIYENNEWHEI